ncbi:hypothetical protein WH47_01188, partial [Habropoda laboriosa]
VSAATMPESARPESVVPVNFSNLVLKRWLHFIGPVRRCEVLKKLKADLQNLGLSRRQVYRGLIQLTTKPRVILTRQPSYRRYGSKKLLEENEETRNDVYASCRTIASFLDQYPQQKNEDTRKSSTTDRVSEDEDKRSEKTERVKICETAWTNNNQGLVTSSRDCKLEYHPPATLHSFDKALEQLDRLVSPKMNMQEKSSSKRTSIVSADSTCKSQHKHWTNNNDIATTKMSNKESNLDTESLDELLHMSFNETCQIISNGNEDAQTNKVSQGRLRVLSSAELGSRWCPTPVNAVTSTVSQLPSTNTLTMLQALVTETAPTTVPTVTAPASIVTAALLEICKIIRKLRIIPSLSKLDYDKQLFTQFEKLKKIMNTEDYVKLTYGVIYVLNREMLGNSPLSFIELFRYTPLLKSLCFRTMHNHRHRSVNYSNGHSNIIPTVVSSQITSNQNTHCNSQASQNMCGISVQSRLKSLLSAHNTQNQTSTNITYKQPQQKVSEEVVLRPQNNCFQSTMSMNSTAANNNNIQQQNYRIRTQETFTTQKISNTNSAKQKQMINIHAIQGFPIQNSSLPPMNQLGGKHISIPVTNAPFINQQYAPQTVFIPQINAFYKANIPNYPVQKNFNSTQVNTQNIGVLSINQQYQNLYRQPVCNIAKGIQLQNVQVPVNYIPQPVQTMFAPPHVPQPVPKNTEQNERIPKQVFPQVQGSMKVPEKISYQHTQNTYSCKTKQPVLLTRKKENMQVSLESTTKLFDILKYLSDIQKLMLLKQVDFYFNCTTWLAGQFTFQQWEKINMQRSLLLNFQTLLRHIVGKTIKGPLSNKSQTNTFETDILANINIHVPKSVQIIVQENKEISYQLDISKIDKEQCKTMNRNQNFINHEENVNITLTQNQSKKEHEVTDKPQNKELSPINPFLETQTTSDINVHQDEIATKLQVSMDTCNMNTKEQNLDEPEQIVEEKTLTVSDLKQSNKDMLHQSNTHSVIVEVSSNTDQVTVVETATVNELKVLNENFKEHEQLQEEKLHVTSVNTSPSLKDTTCGISTIASPKILEKIEHLNDIDMGNSSLEESTVSHIADVRSISLETFEKIAQCNNVPTNITEGNIEEEEIKVCLCCGKLSTVACSICLEAKYCSKECFELHWQDHYKDCTPIENSVIYS